MIESTGFTRDLNSIFTDFQRHYDFTLAKMAFRKLIAPLPGLPNHARAPLIRIIVKDFIGALEYSEPAKGMTRDEKVGFYLDELRRNPEVMGEIAQALTTPSFKYVFNESSGIGGLKSLQKYPELSAATDRYVAAYAAHYATALPHLARELEGTPRFTLLDKTIVKKYRDSLADKPLPANLAGDLATLKSIPPMWSQFEIAAGGLKIFAAYAPALPKADLPTVSDVQKFYSYDEKSRFMTIDFRSSFAIWPWQRKMMKDKEAANFYILLNHAKEVLEQKRPGAVTADPVWSKTQVSWLLPPLRTEITELENEMKTRRMRPPFVPAAVLPGPHVTATSAHG